MNGQPLPSAQGFPARLVILGLYGYVSATKWLSELELATSEGFDAYWVPRGWAKQAPVKTQSRIDVPTTPASVKPLNGGRRGPMAPPAITRSLSRPPSPAHLAGQTPACDALLT
jgi:DMSO/TMAO reductase YedYZ molybdopterin-dependent catalytic subunit